MFQRTYRKQILLIFAIISNTEILQAQDKHIATGTQQWVQYYNEIKFANKWIWLSDGGYRWKDGFEQITQYIVRTGIGYSVLPNLRIASGLAHLGFYSNENLGKFEIRPYQEFLVKNKFNWISIKHRYRVEERFFNKIKKEQLKRPGSFNFRFRYSLTAGFTILHPSKANPEMKILLNITDEIFINAGNVIVYNVFDQNRVMISPSFQLNENLKITLTYNHQFSALNDHAEYMHTKIIWIKIKQVINKG